MITSGPVVRISKEELAEKILALLSDGDGEHDIAWANRLQSVAEFLAEIGIIKIE